MHELSAVRSLRQAANVFAGRPSPKLFVGAAAATVSGRALLGRWGRRDAVAATAVIASRPFAEWLIHRGVLHARPAVVRGRTVDLGAAHRRHHRDPADVDYVLGLLRSKGILCVYGSGFGTAPEDGFFRIVFLAAPAELEAIYDDVSEFTREFRGV